MPRPNAIVFDLDGTLIHSAPDIHFAANAALATLGRGELDLPTVISFIGNGVETLMKRAVAATGPNDPALERKALEVFLTVYAENLTTLTRPFEGVLEALDGFCAAGIKLGICTNKPTEPARQICEQLKLNCYFEVILGAEPGRPKKPQPNMLITTIEQIGADPAQSIYVGDSAVDFQTAQNAGVPFRLFGGGYLNDPLPTHDPVARFESWHHHEIA